MVRYLKFRVFHISRLMFKFCMKNGDLHNEKKKKLRTKDLNLNKRDID